MNMYIIALLKRFQFYVFPITAYTFSFKFENMTYLLNIVHFTIYMSILLELKPSVECAPSKNKRNAEEIGVFFGVIS